MANDLQGANGWRNYVTSEARRAIVRAVFELVGLLVVSPRNVRRAAKIPMPRLLRSGEVDRDADSDAVVEDRGEVIGDDHES